MKLRDALLGCSVGLLRTMARERGLPFEGSTIRSELVDGLAAELTQLAADGKLWRELAAEDRAIVALVAAGRGRHDADLLLRRASRHRSGDLDGAGGMTRVSRLTERGVLFRVFTAGASSSGASYVLPDEYLLTAAPLVENIERNLPIASQLPPVTILESDLRGDCFLLASALRREKWNRAARPLVGRNERSLTRVLAPLGAGSAEITPRRANERWRVLLGLGQQAGWIRGGPWPSPDDDQVSRLLRDPHSLVAMMWAAYCSERISRSAARGMPNSGRVQRGHPARDLLEVVADLPTGSWYHEAELQRWLEGELGWDQGAAGEGTACVGTDGVGRAAARQVRRELCGAWFWLGLVRWGFAADGSALLAVTAAVRVLAERTVEPGPEGDPRLAVLEDQLELVASLGCDLDVLYKLEQYLSFVGGTVERRYLLTAASCSRGVRLGGSADELRSLVRRLAGDELPARWESEVDAWTAAVGRLRADARIVVSASDHESFTRAMDVPAFAAGLEYRLTDCVGWLHPERLAAVLHGLDEAGQPITLGAGLRMEGARVERGAALTAGGAELLWIVLTALRQVDARLVLDLGGAEGLLSALEFVLAPSTRAELDRRAESLAEQVRVRADRAAALRPPRRPMV